MQWEEAISKSKTNLVLTKLKVKAAGKGNILSVGAVLIGEDEIQLVRALTGLSQRVEKSTLGRFLGTHVRDELPSHEMERFGVSFLSQFEGTQLTRSIVISMCASTAPLELGQDHQQPHGILEYAGSF